MSKSTATCPFIPQQRSTAHERVGAVQLSDEEYLGERVAVDLTQLDGLPVIEVGEGDYSTHYRLTIDEAATLAGYLIAAVAAARSAGGAR